MDEATTGVRRSAVYLWGALIVLAWALLSAVFGGSEAHADDESPAPLSGLASLVGDTVGEAVAPVVQTTTETVGQVASPVVATVEKAVAKTTTTVASAPVVGAPVAQVVAKTGDTVSNVTDSVEQVASSAPVSTIVAPVTDAVAAAPVVGTVLDGLGVTGLVDEVASGVDEVLGVATPVIDSTVDPIVDGLQPSAPDAGGSLLPDVDLPLAIDAAAATSGTAPGTPATEQIRPFTASFSLAVSRDAATTLLRDVGARESAPSDDPIGAPSSIPGVMTSTSTVGSGGSAPGASSDCPSSARLIPAASARSGIPVDAALPTSPAGSADVSPD